MSGPFARRPPEADPTVNGFTLLALIVLGVGLVVAYRAGIVAGRRSMRGEAPLKPAVIAATPPAAPPAVPPPAPLPAALDSLASSAAAPAAASTADDERFRLVLAYEGEAASLRRALANAGAETGQLRALAEDRRRLLAEIAEARADTARYRQVLVDLENNAPPPILDGPGAPDDLKLIVGVGPVLERMLQQLGVTTYRQIARWTEHEIEAFDARLPEFHGRIRRDAWVVQARSLHHSKYGEPPPPPRG
jgi:predicted flap endonuclease-1-like 5' DNA nuclease